MVNNAYKLQGDAIDALNDGGLRVIEVFCDGDVLEKKMNSNNGGLLLLTSF
jgi:hypothetical protein